MGLSLLLTTASLRPDCNFKLSRVWRNCARQPCRTPRWRKRPQSVSYFFLQPNHQPAGAGTTRVRSLEPHRLQEVVEDLRVRLVDVREDEQECVVLRDRHVVLL